MATVDVDGVLTDVSSWSWIHWTGVFLSLGIAGINFYVGSVTGQIAFFAVGGSFLLGVGLYVSRFWNPILYLIGILHVAILGYLWVLDGMPFLLLGAVVGSLSAILAVIAAYLFFVEGNSTER
jgi:hypothetical protein